MQLSTDRILTTHVGSLPRPADLLAMLEARESGEALDPAAFDARLAAAVREIVEKQVAAGIDSVCDGEQSKISYTFYVRHRLSGIGAFTGGPLDQPPQTGAHRDIADHPDYAARLHASRGGTSWFASAAVPCCIAPVAYQDRRPLELDIKNLTAGRDAAHPGEVFMNAASPGVLTKFVPDRYYQDEDAYVAALADALKEEYEAIHRAGFILQIDAPDLGSARHNQYQHLSDAEFVRIADRNVAALNHATANIPPEAMRMHICWGNYEGPHTHDVPLATMLPTCMRARPQALLFEAANPRHAHEWEDLKAAKLPDDKVLMPGLVDSTSNFVEHPRLIAQRIALYADIVGRERVIAGTDCGFATFAAQQNMVAPSIAWAKLAALAEGARIATDRLWG
ncbi:MAG TPA: cobalamin-independent methionine synthase II family protein [Stellaceae bacterium]|jgi:5-methyltetrahydropteroyltriglutamate--homocysteine methyltransferase|nr:cobalamin-independent methionine synthase II family protein [Stellaceae bacterium]